MAGRLDMEEWSPREWGWSEPVHNLNAFHLVTRVGMDHHVAAGSNASPWSPRNRQALRVHGPQTRSGGVGTWHGRQGRPFVVPIMVTLSVVLDDCEWVLRVAKLFP
jgi:hypothetical protein